MAITGQIVNVQATVVAAPQPSTLQQSGALVSFGGTTLTTGSYAYCQNLAALTALLSTAGNYVELGHMGATFFAQGSAIGVYVLELGVQASVPTQITDLGTWITNNSSPQIFYAYLVPAAWDGQAVDVETMAGNYSSPTGKTYFFVTGSTGTLSDYTAKSIFNTIPSPNAASSEFQAAAPFYQWLANSPSLAAPTPPMAFRYVFGVTPWPQNSSTIGTILTGYGNVITSAAQGGISEDMLQNGTTMDGNQAIFWYATDWLLINAQQQLTAAVINGSNSNPPLYYNQFGINTLLGVLTSLGKTFVSIGLGLSATFQAIPFATYVAANPDDYAAGIYKGFSCVEIPQLGFLSTTFYVTASSVA